MQDAPAHRDCPASCLSCAVQVSRGKRRKYLACFRLDCLETADQFRGISNLNLEFGITVAGHGVVTNNFGDPEMLRACDMGRQDSQRVGRVVINTFDGTPVEGLGRQADDQASYLPAQVLYPLQIAVQF